MTRLRSAVMAAALCSAAIATHLLGGTVRATVSLGFNSYDRRMYSTGTARYYDYWGNPAATHISGSHWIVQPDPVVPTAAIEPIDNYTGSWSGTIKTAIDYGNLCYRATTHAWTSDSDQEVSSPRVCATSSAPAPKPTCPGDPECPPTGSACQPEDTSCQLSPIVLNLGNGGYDLTGPDNPVVFDLDADGHPDRIAWTAADAPMALLALDRNGNTRIDDGSELFGDATPLPDGSRTRNGFEALRAYDSNADGVIDDEDPIFRLLVLWVDWNHDGRSQPSELTMLSTTNITALDVDYHREWRRDEHGNTFRFGATLHRGRRTSTYYDVFFSRAP